MCSGIARGRRADLARDRVHLVVRHRALHVAVRGGELVGDRAEVLHAERVLDDRVDVGVLEEQRAPAEALEGVPERPDVVAVAIGHGADRAQAEVARGDRDRHRRARPQLNGLVARHRPGGRHDQRPSRAHGRLASRARPPRPDSPVTVSGVVSGRAARSSARSRRADARRGGRPVADHQLDRRGERDVVAVLAEALRDGAGVAAVAQDRRAGEAGSDAGRVDRRAGDADEQARSAEARPRPRSRR